MIEKNFRNKRDPFEFTSTCFRPNNILKEKFTFQLFRDLSVSTIFRDTIHSRHYCLFDYFTSNKSF